MELTIPYRYIVGIEISKQTLVLSLYDHKSGQSVPFQAANDQSGFAELGRWLADNQVERSQVVLCSEHCGRYGEHLLRWSTEAGWPHAVVKTTALKKVGSEHHRKTDAWDAPGAGRVCPPQ